MTLGTVISLCDETGNMVEPWIEAGYDAITIDLCDRPSSPGRLHYPVDVRKMDLTAFTSRARAKNAPHSAAPRQKASRARYSWRTPLTSSQNVAAWS